MIFICGGVRPLFVPSLNIGFAYIFRLKSLPCAFNFIMGMIERVSHVFANDFDSVNFFSHL